MRNINRHIFTKMSKKYCMMILFIISCSMHTIAQTDYYYYKGKKIPLVVNDNKVCVSISKDNKKTCERILSKVQVLNKIKDDIFDIFVISQSDYEKLASLDFWEEDARSVILTSSYFTKNNVEFFASPYLNVRLKNEEDADLLIPFAEKHRLRIVGSFSESLPLYYVLYVTPESDKSPLECANELFESGDFVAAQPDLVAGDLTCSNDPMYNLQWGLHNNNYSGIDISASEAWNYSTGKNIKIAIIDKGVELNHVDLESNISNWSYNTETGSSPSQVDGGHGTHCAGIAAAVKDNGIQIAGVAPDATIISISNSLGLSTENSLKLADGIIKAYQHGADIISCSWYAFENQALEEAIQNAFMYGRQGKGCVVVFASGNFGSSDVTYPANCNDKILAVGSITSTGVIASDSSYGTELDIVAPGDSILSTLLNNTTGYRSGTSMACPHVAGVAALILQRNSELTVTQVNSIINSNAKKLSGVIFNVTKPDGLWNNQYGYGLVDAYSSVMNTPSTVYIQNETITGTRLISAGSIYVGRNVTNTKGYGDVILGQGNITLQAEYVEIKNSTTVPIGTTLTIGN